MSKLKVLIDARKTDSLHLQRLYKRRHRTKNGMQSTMGQIVTKPTYGILDNDPSYHGVTSFWSEGRF